MALSFILLLSFFKNLFHDNHNYLLEYLGNILLIIGEVEMELWEMCRARRGAADLQGWVVEEEKRPWI